MSAAVPLLKPLVAPRPKTTPAGRPRPRLVIVAPGRSSAGRVPFVILIAAVLTGGLLSLLMLHTLAAQDGFQVTALQKRLASENDTLQGLERKVQADSSPSALATRARALGMVGSTIPSYRRLPDGRAVGVEEPAYVPPPVVTTTTTTKTTTKAKAPSTAAGTTSKHVATHRKATTEGTTKKSTKATTKAAPKSTKSTPTTATTTTTPAKGHPGKGHPANGHRGGLAHQ